MHYVAQFAREWKCCHKHQPVLSRLCPETLSKGISALEDLQWKHHQDQLWLHAQRRWFQWPAKYLRSTKARRHTASRLIRARAETRCNPPLRSECLVERTVCVATIATTSSSDTRFYIGATEGPFKRRNANHVTSLPHEHINWPLKGYMEAQPWTLWGINWAQ